MVRHEEMRSLYCTATATASSLPPGPAETCHALPMSDLRRAVVLAVPLLLVASCTSDAGDGSGNAATPSSSAAASTSVTTGSSEPTSTGTGTSTTQNGTAAENAGAASAGPGCPTGTEPTDGLCVGSDADAQESASIVRTAFQSERLGAVIVGVWRKGQPVLVGALGESMTGVPATTDMHHITGNITTGMLTTVLLQLVDDGTLAVDDKLSTWFPEMPSADAITLDMLARNTSGYAHYPSNPDFRKAFYADPFRTFTPEELVQYALSEPLAFPPGTGWSFADTNLLILQMVIEKATGRPMGELIQEGVLDPLGMRNTTLATTADKLEPVLHGYTDERGVWEDATFWNPQWTQYAGGLASNQDDLRRFIEAAGSGLLVSAESHEAQLSPQTVGLGPFTASFYYAMGIGVTNGWVFVNPSLNGYSAGVATMPDKEITVVVYVTRTQAADQDANLGSQLFVDLATLLAPDQAPQIPG